MKNKIEQWQALFESHDGLTGSEIDQMCADVFQAFDREKAWLDAIHRVRKGESVVNAILSSVFRHWTNTMMNMGETVEHLAYNRCAPEVRALEIVRRVVGTRMLGVWDETHDEEEKVALLEASMRADLSE